ncbi:hypothetical protein E1B28_006618 [Marasmius oreades]|uniref:Uncharacterized protein n=1 Tax=Marasmius oreades TaxID=181124 RepID=A0A9P7UWH5_9AGAR|nr:uncharacterized protein E1B28_006618 [Marasmius oreades]KAG7095934.1 hypothetical protein E1B28_006618 [Marasmius oreades]
MVNILQFVSSWALIAAGMAYGQSGLLPKKFNTIPLGGVRPSGWLADQLNVQLNGLAGHEHEFYNYIAQTDWMGGPSRYSTLEEAGSYWFNAAVPGGVLAKNDALLGKAQEFLDYVITHQEEGGWLGPEAGKANTTQNPRYLWGRYPFLFGAIQMVEYDPSQTDKVVTAMHKFVVEANRMLHAGEGMEIWTQTRWADLVMALEWLYDNYPRGQEDLLIDTMKQVKYAGVTWEVVFLEENFPKTAVDHLRNPTGWVLAWHGVNLAEGIKALPAAYRFTHNESDLTRTSEGWDLLFKYHGRPSGIYGADEYLAGLEATRGTELCIVVEMMFSSSFLFQMMGDLKYLDTAERLAYNALPAAITPDHWAHQYDQQSNQIASRNMTPDPFDVNTGYANVFGLEPYYPCCTVNHPQGWPKFISHAFLTTDDGTSLVQVYHGPFQTTATLSGNNNVTVNVETTYPFSDIVSTTITATSSYTHLVRIPSWVVNGTISINGGQAQLLAPKNGFQSVPIPAGQSKFVLNLTPQITFESRPHGAVAIHRGPLLYSLEITYSSKILKQHPQEPRAADYEFDATSEWRFAVDPKTAKAVGGAAPGDTLPSPIFDSNKPPVSIEISGCTIDWDEAGQTFANPPPEKPKCNGAVQKLKLTPYGATNLRISEFPVMTA